MVWARWEAMGLVCCSRRGMCLWRLHWCHALPHGQLHLCTGHMRPQALHHSFLSNSHCTKASFVHVTLCSHLGHPKNVINGLGRALTASAMESAPASGTTRWNCDPGDPRADASQLGRASVMPSAWGWLGICALESAPALGTTWWNFNPVDPL